MSRILKNEYLRTWGLRGKGGVGNISYKTIAVGSRRGLLKEVI